MCYSLFCGNQNASTCSAEGGSAAAEGTTCAFGKVTYLKFVHFE